MEEIFELQTIEGLEEYIALKDKSKLREQLLQCFDKLQDYKNLEDWNRLVRVCEALHITGWGSREPLEALTEKWLNGAYYSNLANCYFETKEGSSKRWKQFEGGYVLDGDNSKTPAVNNNKPLSQRNKLPKNPIRITRSGNYQTAVQPLVDSLQVLRKKLDKQTKPHLYGKGFSYIGINLFFSNHDDRHNTVRSEYYHIDKNIPEDLPCKYYICPRFEIGRLAKKGGQLRFVVTRYYTKAFGFLPLNKQKYIVQQDLLDIVDILAKKLKSKKVEFNTDLLKQDLAEIFKDW